MNKEIYNLFDKFMKSITERIIDEYVDRDIIACGEFGRKLWYRATATSTGLLIGEIWDGAGHIRYVEFGRKPGGKMPPIKALIKWLRCKKIPLPEKFKNDVSFAFAIAKTMQKKGNTWYRIGGAKFIREVTKDDEIKRLRDEFLQDVAILEIKRLEQIWRGKRTFVDNN
jgi:hypothetical protein